MNILCKLGRHKWVNTRAKNKAKLEKEIEENYYDNLYFDMYITDVVLCTKKCERCGIMFDEIKEYTKWYVETKMKQKNNQI
jgi:uncharacterized C2H2 Zn-finger protein